jgi:DNA-binding transcriptional LysR family regulator
MRRDVCLIVLVFHFKKPNMTEGVGITTLPEIAAEKALAERRLVALPWTEGTLEVATLMLWHKDKWLSPTFRAFMDVVRGVMRKSN